MPHTAVVHGHHPSPIGFVYDWGEYERALGKALEMVDYEGLRREQQDAATGATRRFSASGSPASPRWSAPGRRATTTPEHTAP
jgi:hypothetical protein